MIAALANTDLQACLRPDAARREPRKRAHGHCSLKTAPSPGALTRSGLITSESSDARLNRPIFAELLAQATEPKRDGVHRFLDGERFEQYPANLTEREQLLTWVAERALAPDEVVDASTINSRLERFSEDTAAPRRYLVDFVLLERRQDGSQYTRSAADQGSIS